MSDGLRVREIDDDEGRQLVRIVIRRYIIWRNNHVYDERLRRVAARATLA